jgi:CheY-like chemotaxis protein
MIQCRLATPKRMIATAGLPRRSASHAKAGLPRPTREGGRTMACGVLIVEDEPDLRDMLAQMFALEGFQPSVAANGHDALNVLRAGRKPQVIVLDLMMPVMDGWTFLRRQREEPALSGIPVVVVTAVWREQMGELGAVAAVLTKPFDVSQLVDVVREYC